MDRISPAEGTPSWAYDRGVVQQGGVTTICFSRRLLDERSKASPDLRADTGPGAGQQQAVGGRRRLVQAVEGKGCLGSAFVRLGQVQCPQQGFSWAG